MVNSKTHAGTKASDLHILLAATSSPMSEVKIIAKMGKVRVIIIVTPSVNLFTFPVATDKIFRSNPVEVVRQIRAITCEGISYFIRKDTFIALKPNQCQ